MNEHIDEVVKKLVKLRRAIDNHAKEIDEDDIGEFPDLREKSEDLAVDASMVISETLGLLNALKSPINTFPDIRILEGRVYYNGIEIKPPHA